MNELAPSDWATEIRDCAQQLSAGNVSALGHLFDVTAPRLLRYAQTLTRQRVDAEDALQAAIVRIARNPHSLAAVGQPWAYLLTVVRNECLRLVARRRPVTTSFVECEPSPFPEPHLEIVERQAEVQTALRRLPAEQAEVVVLKIWEGMTFQEIASVTGESQNTVASRYRYALAKLELSLRRLADEVGYAYR